MMKLGLLKMQHNMSWGNHRMGSTIIQQDNVRAPHRVLSSSSTRANLDMVIEVDTALSSLHLQLLSQTSTSVLERHTLATVAQVTHVEDHEIVLQSSQFSLHTSTVSAALELADETPTFVLQHTEILVVDAQQHLVKLLVADVVAEAIALTIWTITEVDLVLSRDLDLDVVEHDGLHPPVRFVHLFVGSVSVRVFVAPLVLGSHDAVVTFMRCQPVVVVASLKTKLSQLLSQADLSVLEWNAFTTEAVVVLVEHKVFTLQPQQLTIETTVVHSTTRAHGASALFLGFLHQLFI